MSRYNISADKTYGFWTVLRLGAATKSGIHRWSCRCDCGTERDVSERMLAEGKSKSCGCTRAKKRAPNFKDITGLRFGRLIVLGFSHKGYIGERATLYWDCVCDCGANTTVRGIALRSKNGKTRSCGCLKMESNKSKENKHRTHGHSKPRTPTYIVWRGMISRCFHSSASSYKRYGGRGITVCDRWLKFENFLADIGKRPTGMSIDRIDSNGDYEPGNCRWTTSKQQANNRSNNRVIKYKDKEMTAKEWSEFVGISYSCLMGRLRSGWSIEKALVTPVKK